MDNRVWPISSFQKKKKDQTAFDLRCTYQNFYQRLYVLNYIVLSSILYKFPRKSLLFSPFSSKAVFSFLFTPFSINLNKGKYGLTHIVLFKKWSIFVKSTYGSYYLVFSNISINFTSRYHTVLTILSFQNFM